MRKWIVPLIIIIVLGTAGYFGWRAWQEQQAAAEVSQYQTETIGYGSLTATIGATGAVQTYQNALLGWKTTGTVSQVNVQVGAAVQAGDLLAELDPASLPQNVILAQAELVSAQQALDDLLNLQASRLVALQSVQAARQALLEAQRALEDFETDAYEDEVDQAREDIITAEDDLETAQDDFDPYKDYDPENQRRKDAQAVLDDAQLAYAQAVRALDLLVLAREQAQLAVDLALANQADAQREYDQVKDGPNPDDIAALEARVRAAQAAIDQAAIEAPFAGTVTSVDILPGDQAVPGTPVFRIDDLSKLVVEVRVTEVDVNNIQLDQPVRLTFDAIPNREYGGLVKEVASVGTTVQGVVEFIVKVELTDADDAVKPGMTAAVNIVVNQLGSVLLVPNRAVRLVNGQRVVYVLERDTLQMVEITLGATSDTYSEVAAGGLQTGDLVVLNPPQVFDNDGPPPFVRR